MLPRRPPVKRQSLSPPVWKDQLRHCCLQRLKRDRSQLLARIRRPDACTSVQEEVQRLVATEQQEASLRSQDAASVDDLLLMGRLKENEYLEIVHALEDALRQETQDEDEELRLAEHMADLEDAELEAMLAGMDLDEPRQQEGDDEMQGPAESTVLCPICKADYLSEHADVDTPVPHIVCSCGFTFCVKYVYHSVLEDFQDKIVNAFMTHRDSCFADPTFEKKTLDDGADVLCIHCAHCGCDHALP
ncbi:hypothetical protein DVH05_026985 [Phytophthora capsici]|nr:hypothetical protein DVH05_026985 [Phytophthora capsici]